MNALSRPCSDKVSPLNTLGRLMKSFAFYCTYMQLKTEQLMYSTNSCIQSGMASVCFVFCWCVAFVTQKTISGDGLVIRTVGPRISSKSNALVCGLNHLDIYGLFKIRYLSHHFWRSFFKSLILNPILPGLLNTLRTWGGRIPPPPIIRLLFTLEA